ncbi:MAG TPA: hypothetical protein VEC11_07195 [Allosphingosinicella sp.]|nr:hypothetical protein [Allosphingosinicella sp.]
MINFSAIALMLALSSSPTGGPDVTPINLETPTYTAATRDLEDRFMEATYTDLNGRSVDYGSLDASALAAVIEDLKARHRQALEAFTTAFVRDEIAAGRSEAEARARAARYVDAYFEDLLDTQAELARDAGR